MNPERWRQVRAVFEPASALQGDARAAYLDAACAADDGLRREVESLLASAAQAGEQFLEIPAMRLLDDPGPEPARISRIGSRIGAYQILDLIGHGGMGEVYRAARADGQYQAEVAIKLVRSGIDSELVIARLRQERQILASLEHPNIARLLDGGTTPEGAPYLVIELVAGTPIDQFCDAEKLSVTERLRIFLRVCAAVQYAHQRLVVHRDIKPSNILVTPDGQPKLLDFGIARLLDTTLDASVTLLNALTPEYASPEQIKGQPITTATDVYSLGVVLYRLLTGHSPYGPKQTAQHALARAICEIEPTRPSTIVSAASAHDADARTTGSIASAQEDTPGRLKRRLAGDLDHIVLKAMRKEPADRYSSVEQLARDIEHHLAGRPVSAAQGSFGYSTGKFLVRHKGKAAAAALVLLTLIGGVVSTVHQAHLATRNARRAEQRFNDVRQLATSFLFEFHDAIRPLAGSTPAREMLVKRALLYLDSLARESDQDASLRHELASAYVKVADVQGAPNRDSLGEYAGALQSIDKAIALFEDLIRRAPKDQDLRIELAKAYGEKADLLNATGHFAQAVDLHRKAIALLATLSRPDKKARRQFAALNVSYADTLLKGADIAGAISAYQRAIALDTDVLREDPSDRQTLRERAIAHVHLANGYDRMRRLPEALASARSARDMFQSLLMPTNAQSRRDLAVANAMIAEELKQMGGKRAALAIEQQFIAEDEQAARDDPRNHLARRDVYVDYYKVAHLQLELGDSGDALANTRHAMELVLAEDKAAPGSAVTQSDLQTLYFLLTQILEKRADHRGALDAVQHATQLAMTSVKRNPKDMAARSDLSEIRMLAGDVHVALGSQRAALSDYLQGAADSESAVAADPGNGDWQIVSARLYEKLAALCARRGGPWPTDRYATSRDAARGYYQMSLAIWNDLRRTDALGGDYAEAPARVARHLKELDE